MAKNPQSKDEALEALDFIVNVLKEHERDLDKLISELATVTEQIGDTSVLTGKVENVEEKINDLQKEVASLIGYVSSGSKEASAVVIQGEHSPIATAMHAFPQVGPSVALRCSQWEDFQSLANEAQMLSFSYKEEEKVFEASALKGNQIIAYSGSLPKLSVVLKAFLSKRIGVSERNIIEGVLAPR